jgi:predicted Fe-Mo cluster-binding NifX family protein
MKVGVTATGDNLRASVDPRFGRCRYFIVVDTESLAFETVPNESAITAGGAGIQAAQTLARRGVGTVLTGNVGPNAFQTLRAAGIEVVTGVAGTVEEAVSAFKSGAFETTGSPSVKRHAGVRGEEP